jgi:hypothetical protein
MTFFSDIRKYKDNEDFFTASFVLLLNRNSSIKRAFLKDLVLKYTGRDLKKQAELKRIEKLITRGDFEFQNTKYGHGCELDMSIEVANDVIVFEHKLHGEENEGQLFKYLSLNDRYPDKKFWLVYITINYEELEERVEGHERFLGRFYWEDVYALIKKTSKKTNFRNDPLVYEFLDFMEEERMDPKEGLNKVGDKHLLEAVKFETRLLNIKGELCKTAEDLGYKLGSGIDDKRGFPFEEDFEGAYHLFRFDFFKERSRRVWGNEYGKKCYFQTVFFSYEKYGNYLITDLLIPELIFRKYNLTLNGIKMGVVGNRGLYYDKLTSEGRPSYYLSYATPFDKIIDFNEKTLKAQEVKFVKEFKHQLSVLSGLPITTKLIKSR